MNSLPPRSHRSRALHIWRATWCFLLLACILATAPVAVQGQDGSVSLTLQYHRGLDDSGTLPGGTEVLVYHEAGSASIMLNDWGSRQEMSSKLVEQANASFSETYDRLDAAATTFSIRMTEGHRAYILARLPDSAATPRFYETQVGSNDATSEPDLDRVVSGTMNMTPVANSDWAVTTFEQALEHRSTQLTLQSSAVSFAEDTRVWVWTEPVDEDTELVREELDRGDAKEPALTAGGTTEEDFDRTVYSEKVVYVFARTTNAKGETALYESVGDNGTAGFGAVVDGNIQMQPVPKEHQAAVAAFFPEQDSGSEWFTWTFYGLVGGLLLVVLLLGGRALTKKPKRKNRRRQKSKMERFWGAVMPGGDNKPSGEQSPDQEMVEGRRGKKENAPRGQIEELRSTIETKDNRIEALETKLRRKEQQLKQQRDRNKQKSQRSRTASQSKQQPKPPSTAEKVGKAFKKWCTEGSPAMVDRHHLFGRQIESEISSASFRRIKRENNAAGLVFDDNAQDPVEYWLVEAGGTAYLLPQPTRNGFRELGECFGGQNVSPSQVSTVRPAKLKKRSSGFALQEKGHIE